MPLKEVIHVESNKIPEPVRFEGTIPKESLRIMSSKNSAMHKLKQSGLTVLVNGKPFESVGDDGLPHKQSGSSSEFGTGIGLGYEEAIQPISNPMGGYDYSGRGNGLYLFNQIPESDIPHLREWENKILGRSEKEKKNLLVDAGHAPRFKDIDDKNIIRCPIYSCFKTLNGLSAVNSHIARNHKELESYNIKFLPSGEIQFPSNLIDNAWRYAFLF
jgi:hypothetical protein